MLNTLVFGWRLENVLIDYNNYVYSYERERERDNMGRDMEQERYEESSLKMHAQKKKSGDQLVL